MNENKRFNAALQKAIAEDAEKLPAEQIYAPHAVAVLMADAIIKDTENEICMENSNAN